MKLTLIILFILIAGCGHKDNPYLLQVKPIDEGVYMHTSFKLIDGFGWVDSNGLVVVNDKQALIVDTPWSQNDTASLLSWISAQGLIPNASISTHFHDDRTAGIALLKSKSIPTYTSELTHEMLLQEGKPTASQVFSGDHLKLLDGLVEVYYPGAGHSIDNLVVWLPEQHLLFGGCLVRPLEWKTLGYTGDAKVQQWADSVKNVQSKFTTVNKVVPGHGEVGDEAMLTHTIDLATKAVQSEVR
ncbi:MAG: DIM/SIM/IMP family subclass B1 metallo-beta-lactamase [Marinicella sp.]